MRYETETKTDMNWEEEDSMKKQVIGAALAISLAATTLSGPSSMRALSATDITAVATQPELIAWYNTPATDWESEATPLGNGFIGGMLFGGVENDRIQINEHTLWSGGPGANVNYDGGMNGKPEETKEALQKLRTLLQNKMTEFTKNQAAHVGADGKIVSADYAAEDAELQALINQLMGEKDNFGDYQTFGNIIINDSASAAPRILEVTSNSEAFNEAEKFDKILDGSTATKWFSGAGAPEGYTVPSPIWIAWKYSIPVTAKSYEMVSGNDVPERDPKEWKLYGSKDGKTYDLLDTRTGEEFSARSMGRSFDLAKEVSYQYYKLEILSTKAQGTPCQLSEFKLGDGSKSDGAEANYSNYRRELNLDQGVAKVTYTQDQVDYTREYFINNPSNVVVVRLTANQKGKLTKNIAITSEQTAKTITVQGDTITMTGKPADQRDDGLKFAGQMKVIQSGGTLTGGTDSIDVKNADEILLIMSTGTNYQQCMDDSFDYFSEEDPLTKVSQRVDSAAKQSYQALFDEHVKDYTSLYDKVKLNLCDVAMPAKSTDQLLAGYNGRGEAPNTSEEDRYLENLYYQFGRYLLISSSREGSLPANLQGIWAQGLSSPWNSDYHTNINLQMNYWLAEQTNLSECHLPVIDYVNSLVPRGTLTAQDYYCTQEGEDVRGWVIHHENNIWGNTGPGNYYWGFYFPAAAAWMCQDIWEYYAFNQDKQFLEDNYNTLLQAALFWVDNLWTDSRDGKLVANPSFSPEHGPYSLGTSADQGIIWEIFEEVIKASEALGITSPELDEIKEAQGKLAGPTIGLAGQFMEWKDELTIDITGDGGHRHANHLFALHPGSQIVAGRSEEDDAFVEAMKTTLNTRGDGGTGWSKAWKINFWARLRDGNRAHKLVVELLSESTLKNLFDTHPPFQIDGNFGATAGMTEMLLQSQGNSIDLLPSLPVVWEKGSVSGLKARGNFEVSATWSNKIAQNFTVTSLSGNDCVLNYFSLSKANVVRKSDGQKVEFEAVDTDTISFKTEVGETYVVGNIPQDKVFSDPKDFMMATIENLYSPSMISKISAPGYQGAYIQTVPDYSMAALIGLKQDDLILFINDQEVKDTSEFVSVYDSCKEGDIIRLKVWREKAEQYVSFVKSAFDNCRLLPGQIEAEDYDELVGSNIKTEACSEGGENLGFISGSNYAVFYDVKFKEIPVKLNVRTSGTSGNKVTVCLDSFDGPVVAELFVKATDEWQTYTTNTVDIVNGEQFTGGHDFYLIMNAGMNVNWISFESAGELMPDMELLVAQNEFVNVLENCRRLNSEDYTVESYQQLKSIIEEADQAFTPDTAIAELNDLKQRLEAAKNTLVTAVKEVSAPAESEDEKENAKRNPSLFWPILIGAAVLILGAITVLLFLKKKKIK
ncbi:MAG: hypothetical protein K0S76_628 [Herbinix sp.]|jgi:hypothetical protein|nr:hypothetical protein [Herbinix sp.]